MFLENLRARKHLSPTKRAGRGDETLELSNLLLLVAYNKSSFLLFWRRKEDEDEN